MSTKICPKCQEILNIDATACACGWKQGKTSEARIRRENCGWPNCQAEATPRMLTPRGWLPLCFPHYDDYWRWTPPNPGDPNGWVNMAEYDRTHVSYRERWYADRGLPYEPPKAVDVPPWRRIGSMTSELTDRIKTGELGPAPDREPGEDETYTQA